MNTPGYLPFVPRRPYIPIPSHCASIVVTSTLRVSTWMGDRLSQARAPACCQPCVEVSGKPFVSCRISPYSSDWYAYLVEREGKIINAEVSIEMRLYARAV